MLECLRPTMSGWRIYWTLTRLSRSDLAIDRYMMGSGWWRLSVVWGWKSDEIPENTFTTLKSQADMNLEKVFLLRALSLISST